MNQTQVHRGPDADGIFYDQECAIGLAHRRLSILDLNDHANQPFFSIDGRYVVAFNGEIYNYKELKSKYLSHLTFKTTSDTEVLVELFSTFGTSCFSLLNGMFAGAIYDRQQSKIILFRDNLGKKPLFYYQNGASSVIFASEVKALKALDFLSFKINKDSISTFLHLNFIPSPHTFYQNVYKLKAGHYLEVSASSWVERTYLIDATVEIPYLNFSFDHAKQALLQKLQYATKLRLHSDVASGCLLSGGIDSSLITSLASEQTTGKLNTFTVGFEDAWFDESNFARRVSSHLRTNHHELVLSTKEALIQFDQLFHTYDEPMGDTSLLPMLLVSKMASKHVKMVLTGDGGDEYFYGYGTQLWADRLSNKTVDQLAVLGKTVLGFLGGKYQKAANLLNHQDQLDKQAHIFSQEQGFFSQKELKNLLYNLQPALTSPIEGLLSASTQAAWEQKYYLQEDLLVKVDRASMAYGLEMRSPFLDPNVIAFANQLPTNFKLNDSNGKHILKELLYQYVPNSFFNRPKQGFSIPLHKWLLSDLHYLLDYYLSKEMLEHAGIFDVQLVLKLKQRYINGNHYLFNKVWLVICILKWFEITNSK